MEQTDPQLESPAAKPPPVLFWFKLYCGVLCFLYLAVGAFSLFFFRPDWFGVELPPDNFGPVMGSVFLVMGLALFVACFLPLVLRPRPWVWIYDLIIIALGITSIPLILASIPLLIFWLKPETQRHFGRSPAG
jgi:hypothetical protein